MGGLEQACAGHASVRYGVVVVLVFSADEIRIRIDRVSSSKDKTHLERNCGRKNLVGE